MDISKKNLKELIQETFGKMASFRYCIEENINPLLLMSNTGVKLSVNLKRLVGQTVNSCQLQEDVNICY